MKNAFVYKAELPTWQAMCAHIAERPYRELHAGERVRHAFWRDEDSDRTLADPFPGGYALCLRTDEKLLPSKVVRVETDKEVKRIEKDNDRHLTRDERVAVKEQVLDELLTRALVQQKYTWAYYDEGEGLLYVDTTSEAMADSLMGELVQCCESVKTQTIHVSDVARGLTTRLAERIAGDASVFGRFGVGNHLRLQAKMEGEPVERVTYKDADVLTSNVWNLIGTGMRVEAIELEMGGVYFHLTDKFRFKRFEWPEVVIPDEAETGHEVWAHEMGVKILRARQIVLELCDLMGYEPPKLDEEEADAGTGA